MIYLSIYIIIFITLIAAIIVAISQILFKKGISNKKVKPSNLLKILFKSKPVFIGMAFYLISLVIYLFALKSAPLSIVYPIFASSFIFVVIFSVLFLKERFSKYRFIGIIIIFIGIVVVALSY